MSTYPVTRIAMQVILALYLVMTSLAMTVNADDRGVGTAQNKDDEKKVIREIAQTVIKAAHPTSKKPTVGDYKIAVTMKGALKIDINVQYRGGFTGVTYLAEISMEIDRKDKKVQELEFLDVTNKIKPNAGNLLKARKLIENQLDKLLVDTK